MIFQNKIIFDGRSCCPPHTGERRADWSTHTSFKLILKQQAAQVIHLTHFHCAPIRIGSNTLMTWRNVFVIVRGIVESSRMRDKFCAKFMLPLVAHGLFGPRGITSWDWVELAAKAPLASHGVSVCLSFSICLGSYHSDSFRSSWEDQCHAGMWVLNLASKGQPSAG